MASRLSSHSYKYTIITTIVALYSLLVPSNGCPHPVDETQCESLPADNGAYREYLRGLNTSDLMLTLNVTTTDLAFIPELVSDFVPEPMAINPGCSRQDYNAAGLCTYRYECDYNPQRIPPYIFHANCTTASVLDGTIECKEVYYPVPTLTIESCNPLEEAGKQWKFKTTWVSVACAAQAL